MASREEDEFAGYIKAREAIQKRVLINACVNIEKNRKFYRKFACHLPFGLFERTRPQWSSCLLRLRGAGRISVQGAGTTLGGGDGSPQTPENFREFAKTV